MIWMLLPSLAYLREKYSSKIGSTGKKTQSDDLFFVFGDHRLAEANFTKTVRQNDYCSSVGLFSVKIMLNHGLTWLWSSMENQTLC